MPEIGPLQNLPENDVRLREPRRAFDFFTCPSRVLFWNRDENSVTATVTPKVHAVGQLRQAQVGAGEVEPIIKPADVTYSDPLRNEVVGVRPITIGLWLRRNRLARRRR